MVILKSIIHAKFGEITPTPNQILVPYYSEGDKLNRVELLQQRRGRWCRVITYLGINILKENNEQQTKNNG